MIALENAFVQYGAARVLSDVSIKAAQDEIIAIVGRNGAGKSTTLKTMMGLLPLQQGRRLFHQQDISRQAVENISRLGIALVPDSRRIFPNLSVMENLRMGALAHKPGYWTIARVLEIFPRLQERIGFGGDQLSGGEQQMLSIARALLGNPKILLLDEPTEGLAPLIVNHLIEIFTLVHQQGTGIVLVEQNLKVPMRLAHRQYVLDHGAVAWSGTAAELEAQRETVESIITTGVNHEH
ncbi:ABC transporter ATP-binding protein [Noviherbaspirillum sedimenti]|uniref:ABC transporter ATP-binding protein n=1 Tax=Noviherbaspirillum sedimenti TaxID=2320865 RepID=A0A3A3GIJ7_9BURK|nr:ABC transporter ATP-binding protein [Noviherbaspirillum sedimenti]RJG02106.1 ABC transporter ATP-binding protein [Noviherbaspirillum sedimenti]